MPRLSIIIPIYNEEATLVRVMAALSEALPEAECVYVNDGSKDRSLEILQKHARPEDKVLSKENGGKGSAIRLGIENITGDFCVIQDADLEYDPREIRMLLSRAEQEKDVIVFGSRFLQKNPNIYPLYLLGNKVITWIINVCFFVWLTDSYTCYKVFPTSILKKLPLKARGFELEAELTCYPLKQGYRIVEEAISYQPRSFEEGKKINWKDAVKGIMKILSIRME